MRKKPIRGVFRLFDHKYCSKAAILALALPKNLFGNARAAPEFSEAVPVSIEYDELALVAILVVVLIAAILIVVLIVAVFLVVLVVLVVAVLIVVSHDGASFRTFCLHELLCAVREKNIHGGEKIS